MDNKTLVRNMIDTLGNKWDASKLSNYFSDDFVSHDPLATTTSLAEFRKLFEGYHASFPNMRMVIDAQVEEGDVVVTRFTASGTDTGGFMGRPATGKKVQFGGMQMDRIRDGKIVESWFEGDYLTMLQQLGMVPRFDQPGAKPKAPVQPTAK